MHDRVKKGDYIRYHQGLLSGNQDPMLLDKMIDDLRSAVRFIAKNSYMYEAPDYPHECPYCHAEDSLEWEQNPEVDTHHYTTDMTSGWWSCDSCQKKIPFEEYFESTADDRGRWVYSEQIRSLIDAVYNIDQANSFGDKHAYFEQALQFVHGSGSMAAWLIEGGDSTLNMFS